MAKMRRTIGIDLKMLLRTHGLVLLIPAVLLLVFVVARSTRISSRLFYLFLVQLSMGTIFNSVFTRGKYEFLLYSLIPFSEGTLLLAKNISCMIFTLLPIFSAIAFLEIVIPGPRETIAVTFIDFHSLLSQRLEISYRPEERR
jgi:hypothetical protein